MTVEFYSASDTATSGLLSVMSSVGNSKLNSKELNEQNTYFKDLLNQSKSEIRQADMTEQISQKTNRLDKTDENDGIETSNQAAMSENENEVKDTITQDTPINDTTTENIPVYENDLPGMYQSFQTGFASVLANLNGKLSTGTENTETQIGMANNRVQVVSIDNQSAISDQTSQSGDILLPDCIPILEEQSNMPLQNFKESVGKEQKMVAVSETVDTQSRQPVKLNGVVTQDTQQTSVNGQEQKTVAVSEAVDTQSRQPVKLNGQEQKIDTVSDSGKPQNMQQIGLNGQEQNVLTSEGEGAEPQNNAENTQESLESEGSIAAKTDVGLLTGTDTEKKVTDDRAGLNPAEKGTQGSPLVSTNVSKETPVQTDVSVELPRQIEQKVLQNYEKNKPVTFQMTLSPENLGDIDVQLKYDQGKLIIDIMAVSKETQNLLGKQINQLVRGLALQNVQVESVHLNTPVQESSNSQNSAFLMNSGSDFTQQQNQAHLRENFIRNSNILSSLQLDSEEDVSVNIPENLINDGRYKVNYLI